MPSLHIQPLDPFVVEDYDVSFKRGSDIFANGNVKNFRIYGTTQAKILDVR